jgi:hypothetical protein
MAKMTVNDLAAAGGHGHQTGVIRVRLPLRGEAGVKFGALVEDRQPVGRLSGSGSRVNCWLRSSPSMPMASARHWWQWVICGITSPHRLRIAASIPASGSGWPLRPNTVPCSGLAISGIILWINAPLSRNDGRPRPCRRR